MKPDVIAVVDLRQVPRCEASSLFTEVVSLLAFEERADHEDIGQPVDSCAREFRWLSDVHDAIPTGCQCSCPHPVVPDDLSMPEQTVNYALSRNSHVSTIL